MKAVQFQRSSLVGFFLSISILACLLLATIQAEGAAPPTSDLARAEEAGLLYIQQRISVHPEWDGASLIDGTEYHDLQGAAICYGFDISKDSKNVGHIVVGNALYLYHVLEAGAGALPCAPSNATAASVIARDTGVQVSTPGEPILLYLGFPSYCAQYQIGNQSVVIDLRSLEAIQADKLRSGLLPPNQCQKYSESRQGEGALLSYGSNHNMYYPVVPKEDMCDSAILPAEYRCNHNDGPTSGAVISEFWMSWATHLPDWWMNHYYLYSAMGCNSPWPCEGVDIYNFGPGWCGYAQNSHYYFISDVDVGGPWGDDYAKIVSEIDGWRPVAIHFQYASPIAPWHWSVIVGYDSGDSGNWIHVNNPVSGNLSETDVDYSLCSYDTAIVRIWLRGDANQDRYVSIGDVTKVERIILGLSSPTLPADANQNGTVDMGDVTVIERIILEVFENDSMPGGQPLDSGPTVSINAPSQVLSGSDFTASVDITQVDSLDGDNFDITFDPAVLRLDSVTEGLIGSTTMPIDGYNERSPGNWTVVQNLPGVTGVTGSGTLAVLHFHVLGTAGEATNITLSNGYLSDVYGQRIAADWTGGSVLVTCNYDFLLKWGSYGTGNGYFRSPSGIDVDGTGNVYVADTSNNRIQKFNSSGTFLTKWGSSGAGNGQFSSPRGVAVDANGNVYVADTGNSRIQKFNSSGTFLTKWGSSGFGNGQFRSPYGVAVDINGNVYVADTSNNRIQKFNSSGTFLAKWGSYGSGDGQFSYPVGGGVDSIGNVYVADTSNHRIQKFDPSGTFLLKWGSYGGGDGQFANPSGVALSSSGNLFVADRSNNRIQMFTSSGVFLTKWGASGSGNGQFNYPWDVCVDAANGVYVADTNNHRIQKFGPD